MVEIRIKVIPNSRVVSVEELKDGTLKVKVDATPEMGMANQRLMEIMANHLKIPKSKLRIVSGFKSRNKTLHIDK